MTINYPMAAYRRRPYVISVTGLLTETRYVRVTWRNTGAGVTEPVVADYATPAGYARAIDIDLTDMVTSASTPSEVTVQELGELRQALGPVQFPDIPAAVLLTDPETDLRPPLPYADGILGSGEFLIVPPSVIIDGEGVAPSMALEVMVGDAATSSAGVSNAFATAYYDRKRGVWSHGRTALPAHELAQLTINTANYSELAFDRWDADALIHILLGMSEAVKFQPMDCAKRYAAVQWLSRYGTQKRLVWELRDVQDVATKTETLDTIGKEYDVRKEYERTAVLHLDNLTPYDRWYYGDIVLSDEVEVMMLGVSGDAAWEPVEVTTKKADVPNGVSEPAPLNININWRKYHGTI